MKANNPESMIITSSDGREFVLNHDGTWTELQKSPIATKGEFHYRSARWGMSLAEVIASEGRDPDEATDEYVVYSGMVAELSTMSAYHFKEGVLVWVKLLFAAEHSSENRYLADYGTIDSLLTKKYGRPTDQQKLWNNTLWEDESDQWGLAIASGHLLLATKYLTSESEVLHIMGGDNYEVNHAVDYYSRELMHLITEDQERKALRDL
jgi:hypothetical protein